MVHLRHLITSTCLCALALGAQAQVVRCTDARTGQVTYTDGSCASGSAGREVAPRKSPQEIAQERAQAAEALDRKQQRLQTEALAAQTEALRNAERDRAQAAQAAAAAPQPQDYARSAQCARSRRNLDIAAHSITRTAREQAVQVAAAQQQVDIDCLGPQGYAEVAKAGAQQPSVVVVPSYRAPSRYPDPFPTVGRPAPPPPRLTQCGDFRCTDNQGNSYPRTGPGRFPGPGGTCRSAGGQAPC